jgi:hypothetical protein
MGKYDETRARQILEAAADVMAPDLEARRDAARELIKEMARLTGATRMRMAAHGESRVRLAIGDLAVTICFTGLCWEIHPDGAEPVTVNLDFDPHDKKFVGAEAHGGDGMAALLEAATECMKSRRQAEDVQRSLGVIADHLRH